jgi:hypothetical protein
MTSETGDILKRAVETLDTAKLGLQFLTSGPPKHKLPGLRNVVVFGRAVTNVLQNLRSKEPYFDDWYEPYKKEMKSDSLMKYFYKLRSEILKRGVLELSSHTHLTNAKLPQVVERFGAPPVNAKTFFIGDNLGGSGWEIVLSDGSTEKYYVELPPDLGSSSLHFPIPPSTHQGRPLTDTRIEVLSTTYLDYLDNLIRSAKERFDISSSE